MTKIRLSYSLLSTWARGDVDRAVSTYFHLNDYTSPELEDGIKFHEDIGLYITQNEKLPEWLLSEPTSEVESEQEIIVEYNEMFDIKTIFDAYEPLRARLYEFKSGVRPSSEWARSFQLPLYFLTAEIAGIPIDMAYLIHYNQYRDEKDLTVVHNTELLRDKARQYIDAYGPEIYKYFKENGILSAKSNPQGTK